MPNAALQFRAVRERGLTMQPPDRVENIAAMIARQPTQELRWYWIRRVRELHPEATAERVVGRAQALFQEQQRKRKGEAA